MHRIVSVAEETDTIGSATTASASPPPPSEGADTPAPAAAPAHTSAPDAPPDTPAPPAPEASTELTTTPLDAVCVDDDDAAADRQTMNLGLAVLVIKFSARLRLRVHQGHQLVAKRLGVALMICTGAHVVTLTSIRIVSDQGDTERAGQELCADMTHAVSVAGFVLHSALALAYDGMRARCAVHYSLVAMDPVTVSGECLRHCRVKSDWPHTISSDGVAFLSRSEGGVSITSFAWHRSSTRGPKNHFCAARSLHSR